MASWFGGLGYLDSSDRRDLVASPALGRLKVNLWSGSWQIVAVVLFSGGEALVEHGFVVVTVLGYSDLILSVFPSLGCP